MLSEKLRSFLRFGPVSTRYKDIFDMYYLSQNIDVGRLQVCLDTYIYSDLGMREKDINGIIRRVEIAFSDRMYLRRLSTTNLKWVDENINDILNGITDFLKGLK
jgi:hypothetical protein